MEDLITKTNSLSIDGEADNSTNNQQTVIDQFEEILKSFNSISPSETEAYTENIKKFEKLYKTGAQTLNEARITQIYKMIGERKLSLETIRKLGVIVLILKAKSLQGSTTTESEISELLKSTKNQFYDLALKGKNADDFRKKSEAILREDPKDASFYAKKAVKPTKDGPLMRKHSDIHYKALKEKANKYGKAATYIKAGNALINYLLYCSRTKKIKESGNFFREAFKHIITALTADKLKEWLKSIESLAKLILLEMFEKASERQVAWQLYCAFDKSQRHFKTAVEIAKNLILRQGLDIISQKSSSLGKNNEGQSENSASAQKVREYKKHWRKESEWFHSINSKVLSKLEQPELQKYLRESLRRHGAESRFFDPRRFKDARKKKIMILFEQIVQNRYRLKKQKLPPPIDLRQVSARLYITAERLFQETIIALSGCATPSLGIPFSTEFSKFRTCFGSHERYNLGVAQVTAIHRTEPRPRSPGQIPPRVERLGDSYCYAIPKYYDKENSKDIISFFNRLTSGDKEKEKKLASFMIRFAHSHQPKKCARPTDSVDLNRCCFLVMEKEQAQFHSATCLRNFEKMHIGMTVAQARALILIKGGWLCFEEFIKTNALFAVYAHSNVVDNISRVEEKCQNIEKLYKAYLEHKNLEDRKKFLKQCIKDKHDRVIVLTREQAHKDLLEVYGGDGDTSGEEYLSDVD